MNKNIRTQEKIEELEQLIDDLDDWRFQNNISTVEMCRRLKVSRMSAHGWYERGTLPRKDNERKIRELIQEKPIKKEP